MKKNYPRDMIGYGSKTPVIKWPNGAKIALQIVLNYEEGAENCVLHGDKTSEVFLSEIIGAQPIKGRHINMESFYEYGSKRGFWRLHELFQKKKIPSVCLFLVMPRTTGITCTCSKLHKPQIDDKVTVTPRILAGIIWVYRGEERIACPF